MCGTQMLLMLCRLLLYCYEFLTPKLVRELNVFAEVLLGKNYNVVSRCLSRI